VFHEIADVFRQDGPAGELLALVDHRLFIGMKYESYTDFYRIMDNVTSVMHGEHLVPKLIPLVGIGEQLEQGIHMLDVGCGSGFHVSLLGLISTLHYGNFVAENFPKTNFTGIDLCLDAVTAANQARFEQGKSLQNAAYFQMDARKLKDDWTEKFDWVTIFDACHDQTRPDLVIYI
jgi:SAM-dependent methyltransferase